MAATISVPLFGGLSAVIDADDYERYFDYTNTAGETFSFRICDLSWHAEAGGGKHRRKTTYARTSVRRLGRKFSFRMHTLILGKKDSFVIDHEDGNGLNNRRTNLSHISHGENVARGKSAARLKIREVV